MELKDYFESTKGVGVMATADGDGRVDAAIYARPHFMGDETLAFIMRDRLTHHNLQSNAHATFLFIEDGPGYKGKRLFLTKVREEQDSELLHSLRRTLKRKQNFWCSSNWTRNCPLSVPEIDASQILPIVLQNEFNVTREEMEPTREIRSRLNDLCTSQKLAVVSTQSGGQPYASLVAFVASDDLRSIFFVTARTTRKFANLKKDPRVAVLINSSTNEEADFHDAVSITATGTAEEIKDLERDNVLTRYLSKHPHLDDFVYSPSCAVIKVTTQSYYMVQNFQKVMELHLDR
jgi:nitroimidazol reductase NimA-like FMN-containing flavoprotein (pyridoxamine 5'-phosphate oxidase superfamily)